MCLAANPRVVWRASTQDTHAGGCGKRRFYQSFDWLAAPGSSRRQLLAPRHAVAETAGGIASATIKIWRVDPLFAVARCEKVLLGAIHVSPHLNARDNGQQRGHAAVSLRLFRCRWLLRGSARLRSCRHRWLRRWPRVVRACVKRLRVQAHVRAPNACWRQRLICHTSGAACYVCQRAGDVLVFRRG